MSKSCCCVCNNMVDTAAKAPALTHAAHRRANGSSVWRSTRAAEEAHGERASHVGEDGVPGGRGEVCGGDLPSVRVEQVEPDSQGSLSTAGTYLSREAGDQATLGSQSAQEGRIGQEPVMVSPHVLEDGDPARNGQVVSSERVVERPKPSWLEQAQDEVGWHTGSDPEFDSWL